MHSYTGLVPEICKVAEKALTQLLEYADRDTDDENITTSIVNVYFKIIYIRLYQKYYLMQIHK